MALVVPILLLARSIGNEAPKINDALTEAVHNTAPLGALARPSSTPRSSSAACSAAAPGWEDSDAYRWHVRNRAHPVGVAPSSLGFVVVLAVAALLSLLIWLVKIIDRRVGEVRDTLKAAAANTADTTLIPQVAEGVEAVLAEGLQHHLFLGRVLGKVKS